MNNNQNKQHDFKIEFKKESHSLDVNTYIRSLSSLSVLLKEVNYQVCKSGPDINISVVAQESGSFDVIIRLQEAIKDSLPLVAEGAGALASIVSAALGVIQLRKHAKEIDKDKTEFNGNKVILKNSNGNTVYNTNITVYNLYDKNQAINDAITEQFRAVRDDKEVTSVVLHDDGENVVLDKDDIDTLSERQIIDTGDKEESVVRATLTVSKLVLDDRKRKWEFVYQGNKINAKIVDDEFWRRVLSSEEGFKCGDQLVCDLNIIREYDETLRVYLDKEYFVSHVSQHLPRVANEQTGFEMS